MPEGMRKRLSKENRHFLKTLVWLTACTDAHVLRAAEKDFKRLTTNQWWAVMAFCERYGLVRLSQ